jgi:serine/threonine-protein kinase
MNPAMKPPATLAESRNDSADASSDGSEGAVVVPAPSPFEQPGKIVSGRYRLEAHLAGGAMGSIWRARHLQLKAPVAVKFLEATAAGNVELHNRFLQEARAAAAVRSAHVVQVFDYGTDAGIPYIVMELLEGESLERRLARRVTLSAAELDKIFAEVARGVSLAHATGVVHRDLKPGNIFIAQEGPYEVTKLIDFGIAKVDPAVLEFTLRVGTKAGTVIGTPQYMSPEQLRGGDIDQRVDLWALGVVAFECLTGQSPYQGQSVGDLAVQICTEKPSVPSRVARVPAGFDRWFAKATHKDIDSRFESAEEMAAALSVLLEAAAAEDALARGSRSEVKPRVIARRRSWRSARVVGLSVAALACAVGVFSALRSRGIVDENAAPVAAAPELAVAPPAPAPSSPEALAAGSLPAGSLAAGRDESTPVARAEPGEVVVTESLALAVQREAMEAMPAEVVAPVALEPGPVRAAKHEAPRAEARTAHERRRAAPRPAPFVRRQTRQDAPVRAVSADVKPKAAKTNGEDLFAERQ